MTFQLNFKLITGDAIKSREIIIKAIVELY